MNSKHEPIRQDLLLRLLRFSHWDPQSHDREGLDFAFPLVGQIIDKLEAGERVETLRALTKTSGMISEKFNELGYYRSVLSAQPLKPEEVEKFMRDTLSDHFTIPPKLGLV